MKPPIEDTRRHLGELSSMSAQVEATERRILSNAEKMLESVNREIEKARPAALSGGGDASMQYQNLIAERGRLNQVIAQAREMLRSS